MAQGHCLIAGPPRSGPSLLGGREPEQRVGAHSLAVLGTRTRRLNRLAGATARVLFALSKALGPPQELFLHLGAWQGCLERSGPPLPLTTTPPPALPNTSRRSVSAWVSRPHFPKLSRRSATGRQPGSDLRVGRGVVQVRYRSRELRRV